MGVVLKRVKNVAELRKNRRNWLINTEVLGDFIENLTAVMMLYCRNFRVY